MKKHENKVAVITGGNSDIGYGIVDELILLGAKVIITGKIQNTKDHSCFKITDN